MLTLFHHPFCPHSRFVRLALGEYGVTARMVEERVWERRQEFLILNPPARLPCWWRRVTPQFPARGLSPNTSMKREASSSEINACCRASPDRGSKYAGL